MLHNDTNSNCIHIEVFQSRDIGRQAEAEESEKSEKFTRNEFDYINMDIIKLSSDFLNFQTL